MARPFAALALLTALLLLPAAAAHTTATTEDGAYRIVVGNLNEPITTYTKTGLDLQLQANNEARTPVTINPGNLTAVLIAPDGTARLERPLQAQYGKPGAYTFDQPYVLTQPGQYVLRLDGDIRGTPVAMEVNVAGPVGAQSDATFPDANVATPHQLQAQLATLQQRITQLEAQLALSERNREPTQQQSPGLPSVPVLALLALAALAVARRRA